MSDFPTIPLFGLPLAAVTADEFIARLIAWSGEADRPRVAGYLNAHTANLLHRDPAHRANLERMDLVYADGMAVVRATRRLAPPGLPERVNAGDFLTRFLWTAATRGRRVALVGSRPRAVTSCAAAMEKRVDGLRFVLVRDGHFGIGSPEEARLLEELRAARPDILLAGMGSPRQEAWALSLPGHGVTIPVTWCVGALFEYYGYRRRAPVWMREAGLEWAFRLALEPRRLARRYLLGNIEFLYRVRQAARK
ncbi:MAG: hypothetical protein PWP23_869 [Candidatus Sumerlaeota bacterium]|nr:hypothetical protein [Candidatus Sumerlaeota bacterium]